MYSGTVYHGQTVNKPDGIATSIKIEPLDSDCGDEPQAVNLDVTTNVKTEFPPHEPSEYDTDTHQRTETTPLHRPVVKTEYVDVTEKSEVHKFTGKENDHFLKLNKDLVLKNELVIAPSVVRTGPMTGIAQHLLHSITGAGNVSLLCNKTKADKPHCCEVCKKCFKRKAHLKEHMYIHNGNKPYSCEPCQKFFATKGNLKEHIAMHDYTGEKPYICEMCEKCFRLSSQLKMHMLIHTGEKPFSCPVCRKCFRAKTNLKEHMLIHTGEKLYACYMCKKCFKTKRYLKQHVMIHTGGKPYCCDLCKRFFKTKKCLRQHLDNMHTAEKSHACHICNCRFKTKQDLSKHLLILHSAEKA
ncbi:zinc finger protein 98-like [Galleria mellonella]|uniref:Zinc finger protein 98-like n=1 Tax=Galleria mellonella TaxID=7137 RepID=A0A6J3C602_GALME|nr:zinc finger protein 98-like [Galleria mellonella]XP_052754788.1 zinc finger protein 98-like [Galleria mellonella]XP_052754791.1 zinc finger protein 98-like [Galleria mellonella]